MLTAFVVWLLIIGLLFLIFGIIFKFKPPKEVREIRALKSKINSNAGQK